MSSSLSIADEYVPPAGLDPTAIGDEELEEEECENDDTANNDSNPEITLDTAVCKNASGDTKLPEYPTIFLLPSRAEYWQLCRKSYEEHERVIIQVVEALGNRHS